MWKRVEIKGKEENSLLCEKHKKLFCSIGVGCFRKTELSAADDDRGHENWDFFRFSSLHTHDISVIFVRSRATLILCWHRCACSNTYMREDDDQRRNGEDQLIFTGAIRLLSYEGSSHTRWVFTVRYYTCARCWKLKKFRGFCNFVGSLGRIWKISTRNRE